MGSRIVKPTAATGGRAKAGGRKPGPPRAAAPDAQSTLPETEPGTSSAPRLKMPELLAELEEAAKQLGIRVSYDNLAGELGSGGLCKVRGEWRAILDKRCTPSERVSMLAMVLIRFPLETLTLTRQVQELIEQARKQAELKAAQEAAEAAEAAAQSTAAGSGGPQDGLAQSGAGVVS
ncbi:MAG: hypothetical protein U1A78_35985 [Polyangia bacterium]